MAKPVRTQPAATRAPRKEFLRPKREADAAARKAIRFVRWQSSVALVDIARPALPRGRSDLSAPRRRRCALPKTSFLRRPPCRAGEDDVAGCFLLSGAGSALCRGFASMRAIGRLGVS